MIDVNAALMKAFNSDRPLVEALTELMGEVWDEGYAARKSEDVHSPGESNPYASE